MIRTSGATLVQYVFLDVVRFTQGRTIEAQVDIIASMNTSVLSALDSLNVPEEERILSPTGDGLAIALLQPTPFDIGLKLSLEILQCIHDHNSSTGDQRRQFDVRVGINQNIDNLLNDINGNRNLAGRGINQAQRIMSLADGRQVLLGNSVYEVLCERESYDKHFRSLPGKDKHGNRFSVFQLIHPNEPWLNTDLPIQFRKQEQPARLLTLYAAHFICNAVYMRDFLLSRRTENRFEYCAAALLHLLTLDSMENSSKHFLEKSYYRVEKTPNGSPTPTWNSIINSEFWIVAELYSAIDERLSIYSSCFEISEGKPLLAFPSENGIKRVQAESPEVWSHVVKPHDA